MYTFTEEEFTEQVTKSKSWGDPTLLLQDMVKELIVEECRQLKCPLEEKVEVVNQTLLVYDSTLCGYFRVLLKNVHPEFGHMIDHFKNLMWYTIQFNSRYGNKDEN